MKKILFSILCAGAVISCAKDVVITADHEAITFESAFVDNATKAAYDGSYNNNNFKAFQVYATITGTGSNEGTANIFKGESVIKGASLGQGLNWSYATANTQYWIPGNDYQFRAIADGNVSGVTEVVTDTYGMATAINLLDASAQKDILTAQHNVTNYTKPTSGTPAAVAFTFAHVLSKAKFTVKNTITTNNGYSYKVTNVVLNDLAKNGVYTITDGATGSWTAASAPETYDLPFGDVTVDGKAVNADATVADIKYNASAESNFDRLLIPGTQTLNITFSYGLYKDGVLIDAQDKTITAENVALEAAKAYNFVISLGNPGDPIQFDVVKVNDWDEKTPIAVVDPIEASTAKAFKQAVVDVEEYGTILITADMQFTTESYTHNTGSWYDGIYYVGDKSFTIDLGGNTIGNDGAVNDYLFNFKNAGSKASTITIKNGKLDAGTAAFCALCTSSTQENQLTINLENVELINNMSNGSTAKIRGGVILNVNSGTKITGKASYLGIECIASTVNIYDGAEIYMDGTVSYNGCLAGVGSGGTINVYGGYGKGVKGGFIAMTSGGTINIKGGEWIANTDGTIGDNSNLYVLTAQSNKYESGFVGPAIINVEGGTFRGGMDAWVLNNIEGEKAELNISGGNFNADPTNYLVTGKTATENTGIWTVK